MCNRNKLLIISAVFVPLILFVFYLSTMAWIKNDYVFVNWPPSDITQQDASVSDNHQPKLEKSQIEVFENDFDSAPEYEHLRAIVESPPKDTFNATPLNTIHSSLPPLEGMKKMPKLPLKSDRIKDLMRDNEEINISGEINQRIERKTSREDSHLNETHNFSDSEDGEEVPMLLDLKRLRLRSNEREGWRWFSRGRAYILRRVRPEVSVAPEDSQPKPRIPTSFWPAFIGGFVTLEESFPLCLHMLGFLLILGYGETLARFVSSFAGHAFWVVTWLLIVSSFELRRYLNTYVIPIESRVIYFLAGFIHVSFCVLTFVFELESSIHSLYFFWLLDYFFLFPILASLIFHLCVLADIDYLNGGPFNDKLGEGLMISLALAFIGYSGIVMQMYFWVDALIAEIMIAILILGIIVCTSLHFWRNTEAATFVNYAKRMTTGYYAVTGIILVG